MTKDHDVVCAEEVAKMHDLGCFVQEFSAYATCYISEGDCYFFASDHLERAYAYSHQLLWQEKYPLPIMTYTNRALVPSGRLEQMKEQHKLEAVRKLKGSDGQSVAEIITTLAKPASNIASTIIDRLRQELYGCFDGEHLQLFEGLVDFAFMAKKIPLLEYIKNRDWLAQIRQDVFEGKHIQQTYQREYAGFLYFNANHQPCCYYNAVEAMVLEKSIQLACAKVSVSPILRKKYYFNEVDQLTAVAADFRAAMRRCFTPLYVKIWQYLYQLPSVINKDDFYSEKTKAAKGNELLKQSLNYYGTIWNLW